MKYCFLFIIPFLFACESTNSPKDMSPYKIPTVAILEFENKAQFSFKWNLGGGMRDILVDELVQSGQFNVVTRRDLDAVLGEINLQKNPHFRRQKKADFGQLKNVQYLIKGSVTDFAHVASSGARAFFSNLGVITEGQTAIVTVSLYIIEVETGEIVASRSLEGKVYAGVADIKGTYKGMGFGGRAFYRTPLGRATKDVMRQAMESLADVISRDPWHPSVMKVQGDKIYVSGGHDRHLSVGTCLEAYSPGEKLLSPDTGDVLDVLPGELVATLKVVEVKDKYSIAVVESGQVFEGQNLSRRQFKARPLFD